MREVVDEPDDDPYALSHMFAPDNTRIYKVKPKANLWGIGYDPLDGAEDVRAMRDRNRAREKQLTALERGGDSQRRARFGWPIERAWCPVRCVYCDFYVSI